MSVIQLLSANPASELNDWRHAHLYWHSYVLSNFSSLFLGILSVLLEIPTQRTMKFSLFQYHFRQILFIPQQSTTNVKRFSTCTAKITQIHSKSVYKVRKFCWVSLKITFFISTTPTSSKKILRLNKSMENDELKYKQELRESPRKHWWYFQFNSCAINATQLEKLSKVSCFIPWENESLLNSYRHAFNGKNLKLHFFYF